MKSEHRHELKTNELGRIVSQATPFLERYANYILIGLAVVIIAATAAVYFSNTTSPATAGWTAMVKANSAEDFATVADDYPNTEVGDWARLIEAESYLENAIRSSFTDRASANSDLNKSREILEQLSKKSGVPEGIRKRALFALARCAEASGEADQAVDLYKQLVREYDDPVYKDIAEGRISVLETADAKDFYAWFRKQNPKPEDRQQPRDGMSDPFGLPPGHPPILTLPELPDELKLPEEKADTKKASSMPAEAAPAGTAATPEKSDAKTPPPAPEKTTGEQKPAPTPPTESKEGSAETPAPPK